MGVVETRRPGLIGGIHFRERERAQKDMAKWAKFEKTKPYFVTLEQIKQGLAASHLDVQQAADMSKEFCSHITHNLAGLTNVLKQGTIPNDQRSWIMWEFELWARRFSC